MLYPLSYGGLLGVVGVSASDVKNTTRLRAWSVHGFAAGVPERVRGAPAAGGGGRRKCPKAGRGGGGADTLGEVSGVSGRVLVVDDSEVIRQLIRVNLELEGFEVVTAADGAECLEVVRRVKPDVVTLDVMMPRLDGLRTAARLRATPGTSRLPIAIVSACTPADLDLGEAVGVDGYLGKPFDPADLVALVRRLMALGGQPGGFRPERTERTDRG